MQIEQCPIRYHSFPMLSLASPTRSAPFLTVPLLLTPSAQSFYLASRSLYSLVLLASPLGPRNSFPGLLFFLDVFICQSCYQQQNMSDNPAPTNLEKTRQDADLFPLQSEQNLREYTSSWRKGPTLITWTNVSGLKRPPNLSEKSLAMHVP